jgi:hypothetical protein
MGLKDQKEALQGRVIIGVATSDRGLDPEVQSKFEFTFPKEGDKKQNDPN